MSAMPSATSGAKSTSDQRAGGQNQPAAATAASTTVEMRTKRVRMAQNVRFQAKFVTSWRGNSLAYMFFSPMDSNTPDAGVDQLFLAFQLALAGRYSIDHELGRGGMGVV